MGRTRWPDSLHLDTRKNCPECGEDMSYRRTLCTACSIKSRNEMTRLMLKTAERKKNIIGKQANAGVTGKYGRLGGK